MKSITVNTGFGYIKNNLDIAIARAELPVGEHLIRDCETYVEVASQAEMLAITISDDESYTPIIDVQRAIVWKHGEFPVEVKLQEDNSYIAILWINPEVEKPNSAQLTQIIQDYLNSKEYDSDNFDYETAIVALNEAFWDKITQIMPTVGLISLWLERKNFTAIKTKGLEWVASELFTQEDFDTLNNVLKTQGVDLLQW